MKRYRQGVWKSLALVMMLAVVIGALAGCSGKQDGEELSAAAVASEFNGR